MNMMVLPNEEKLQLDLVHTGFKSEFAYSVLETFNATLDLIYVSAISNQNPTLGDLLQEHPSELDTQGCCGLNIELNPLILKHGTNISTWSTFAKLTKWALFPADK
jgi:hypothetical protein